MKKISKLVVLDGETSNPGDLDWSELEARGPLTIYPRTADSEILQHAENAEVLFTNKVPISSEVLEKLPCLKLLCLTSTGTNIADLDACRKKNIPVCNVPAYSTASVSELVLALVMAWSRSAETHASATREGAWARCPDFSFHLTPQKELAGKTMGIIGFGSIGQAVGRWAAALGMKVVAYTRNPADKPQDLANFLPMEAVFRQADVLSLHCPLTVDTRELINPERLGWMKPDAFLVNTGRGELVDEVALRGVLDRGELGGAGLDVLSQEPPPPDHPLVGAPRCWIVPHIGWATREARARLIATLVENVSAWQAGTPQNVVNGVEVP